MPEPKRISIRKRYLDNVTLSCNEYHAHSIMQGCFTGDRSALDVLFLCEEIDKLRSIINGSVIILKKGVDG